MIQSMNNLPQQDNTDAVPKSQIVPITGGVSVGKEAEAVSSSEVPLQDVQKELEVPKEVLSSGVKVRPTVVPIPKSITQMGVKPAGSNVGVGTGQTITLPLTQIQIAQGLQKSIVESWRWLAVWCIRRLKQLRLFQTRK